MNIGGLCKKYLSEYTSDYQPQKNNLNLVEGRFQITTEDSR